MRKFSAYEVYYSGASVDGNSLDEVIGDPDAHKDQRDAVWFLLYGECKDPPPEGGCQIPLQIHNYSTCTRWADPGSKLFTRRGAKAANVFGTGPAALVIYTGRTTVTVTATSKKILASAVKALRDVREPAPSPLPPPAPGSLEGRLPCQHQDG
jgi:hypothetical protein